MSTKYDQVAEIFASRNCKLLTTNEDYYKIIETADRNNYKLDYIASCGHNHTVFYNVFKSRNTGIICPSCKNKNIGDNKKKLMLSNEMSKLCNLQQEFTFVKKLQELTSNELNIVKAFDGCMVDVIYKPKNIVDDKWVGIQVKTTKARNLTYSFHIQKLYTNCLLLLYCVDDDKIWLIPENTIGEQSKISIGYNKSKYDIYSIDNNNLINKLIEIYNTTSQFSFDKLDTPINIYQKREKDFRKFREEAIPFLNFTYDEMEGTVYDFKIGNLKIQEKVSIMNDRQIRFCLFKANGHNCYSLYTKGDNDFYWLNSEDRKAFFVIPENALLERITRKRYRFRSI